MNIIQKYNQKYGTNYDPKVGPGRAIVQEVLDLAGITSTQQTTGKTKYIGPVQYTSLQTIYVNPQGHKLCYTTYVANYEQ